MNILRNKIEYIYKEDPHGVSKGEKHTVWIISHSMDGINKRFDTAENTSKLKDAAIEDTQNEAQRKKWPKVTNNIRAYSELNQSENTTFQICEM